MIEGPNRKDGRSVSGEGTLPKREMKSGRVRVWIVGCNRLLREALQLVLAHLEFEVSREFDSVEQTPLHPRSTDEVDLLLYDLEGGTDRLAADIRLLKGRLPQVPVVVLADRKSVEVLDDDLVENAAALLTRDMSLDALGHSLRLVVLGEKLFPRQAAEELLAAAAESPTRPIRLGSPSRGFLSPREREILGCLVDGFSNKVIATRLRIAESTVKVHMKNLLRKIPASNRTQAAIWAVRHNPQAGPRRT